MDVTLYERGPTRSARCRWTLAEAGIAYQSIERRELIGSDELKRVHPLGKLPAAVIDGKPLFESAAICTYIADHAPGVDMIAASGSWGRALHDQWVAYCLSEMEAWLWNTAVNTFVLPEERRITTGFDQNAAMFKRAANAPNVYLAEHDYLVEERFTVTDIIVGWTVNWGRRQGHLDAYPAVLEYIERLLSRPHCCFARE